MLLCMYVCMYVCMWLLVCFKLLRIQNDLKSRMRSLKPLSKIIPDPMVDRHKAVSDILNLFLYTHVGNRRLFTFQLKTAITNLPNLT